MVSSYKSIDAVGVGIMYCIYSQFMCMLHASLTGLMVLVRYLQEYFKKKRKIANYLKTGLEHGAMDMYILCIYIFHLYRS